jgi:cell division protein FtsW (lipid II flippase)
VVLVFAGLTIARREKQIALKLFAMGVTFTIGMQAIINLAVVTVVAPTKGIALPLISAGGTGWILTCCSLGLLIAVDRTQRFATADVGEGLGVPLVNTASIETKTNTTSTDLPAASVAA